MSYRVFPTPEFKRTFKRLYKKYPSLKADLQVLIDVLSIRPQIGTSLGHGIYKVRLAIASKARGKSGGARVITYLVSEEKEVYLVYIYDKSQLDNMTMENIVEMLKRANLL